METVARLRPRYDPEEIDPKRLPTSELLYHLENTAIQWNTQSRNLDYLESRYLRLKEYVARLADQKYAISQELLARADDNKPVYAA